jgi:hypothetical protein
MGHKDSFQKKGKVSDRTFIAGVADIDDLVFAAVFLVFQDFHQRVDPVGDVSETSFLMAAVH